MRRSYPHFRRDLLFTEDANGVTQFDLLNLIRQAGKFAAWHSAIHAGGGGEITMLIAMQPNGPTMFLPGPHTIPEIVHSRRADHEISITVIRDDRHQRFDIQLVQVVLERAPNSPVHRRTNIVESQNESCSHGHSRWHGRRGDSVRKD